MDITLGIKHGRDLQFTTADSTKDVEAQLAAAMADGSVFSVTDAKGRRILVPGDRILFAELGAQRGGAVGFRS